MLTHEAIVDSAWDQGIRPLLVKRFPEASADDLLKARAYAYGGCIIQDMGYYPFGSRLFTDLVHYVRSGDFVVNLIRDSDDLDGYAFALGALSHYAADNQGHSLGVNPSVGIEYPRLRRRFGPIVTYADDRTSHLRVEFSFDVQQVARGNYVPKSYHDFIGFEVSKPLLERAFEDTYSLKLKDIFSSLDLALGMYRYTVSHIIPDMTTAAWKLHKDDFMRADPKMTRRRFVYRISRAEYRKEWNNEPGFGIRALEFIIRITPKIGPLSVAKFKPPAPAATADFGRGFDAAVKEYRTLLAECTSPNFQLQDRDFDTGKLTRPTEYRLADDAYSRLAIKLASKDPAKVDRKVRANVLVFYKDMDTPFATKKHRKQWQDTVAALKVLQAEPAAGSADRSQ